MAAIIGKFVYGEFSLIQRRHIKTNFFFKGIEVKKEKHYLPEGVNALIDIYGLETKDTISLDRSSFTREGTGQVFKILEGLFDIYKNYVIELLNNKQEKQCISEMSDFDTYTFWLLCNPIEREQISSEVFSFIEKK